MDLQTAEFAALRSAISARGTTRIVIAVASVATWATLTVALLLLSEVPLGVLVPLAVLVGGFEAVHGLHVGVERIGRYLQVFYEDGRDGPQWETAAMAVGPTLPGGGVDPLFSAVFIGAALLNVAAAIRIEPIWQELAFLGVCHAAFVLRVVRARTAAARQRAVELDSFKALLLGQRDRG